MEQAKHVLAVLTSAIVVMVFIGLIAVIPMYILEGKRTTNKETYDWIIYDLDTSREWVSNDDRFRNQTHPSFHDKRTGVYVRCSKHVTYYRVLENEWESSN